MLIKIKVILYSYIALPNSPDMQSPSPSSPLPESFEEEKFVAHLSDSITVPFTPKPSQNYLELNQNLPPSTQTQISIPESPILRDCRRGRRLSDPKNMNHGHWSLEENKKYHWFLEIHFAHFVNRHMRRMDKIFKSMEIFVGTRLAEQCRSHHQKMEKKYLNFSNIITNLRKSHYNSLHTDPILEELNSADIVAIDGLATIQYLIEQQSVDPAVWEFKERKKSGASRTRKQAEQIKETKEYVNILPNKTVDFHEIQEQKEVVEPWMNMLEEEHMNIGLLNLGEIEENSCLFNSLLFQL